jgi:hypothetical protein
MCSIRVIVNNGWDVYQIMDGVALVEEYWIKQNSLLTLEDGIREHGRAIMAGGDEKVSEARDRKAMLN